jgi:hypothetical protein
MQAALIKSAIEFAKNKQVQRIAIGFVVGAAVGYAIAKTTEPYLFPEPELEMIPPYDTPEDAFIRETFELPVGTDPATAAAAIKKMINTPAHDPVIPVKYEGVSINPDALKGEAVANKVLAAAHVMPKPKYMKPVRVAETHAKAVAPTVQPVTAPEKMAMLKDPAPIPLPTKNEKPAVSTFSSTRGQPSANTGGGNPHKKTRPIDTGE